MTATKPLFPGRERLCSLICIQIRRPEWLPQVDRGRLAFLLCDPMWSIQQPMATSPNIADVLQGALSGDPAARDALQAVRDAVVLYDATGTIVACNRRAAELLGTSEQALVGATLEDPDGGVLAEDGTPLLPGDHPVSLALATGEHQHHVIIGRPKPDGLIRWLEVSVEPIGAAPGKAPSAAVMTCADVTQARLRDDRYDVLASTVPVGVFEADTQGRLRTANEVLCEILGSPRKDILGIGWHGLLHPDNAAETVATWRSHIAQRKAFELEARILRADGSQRWLLWVADTIRAASGRITGWIGGVLDLTAKRAAEHAAMERERTFHALAHAAPATIFQTDRGGYCTFMGPQWELLTGLPAQSALGHGWLGHIHPDDRGILTDAWRLARLSLAPTSCEFRMVAVNGVIRTVLGKASSVVDASGHLSGFVGALLDVTDRAETERLRREIISVVSHELRTPLTSLLGALELLGSPAVASLEPQAKTLVDMALRNASRLLRLVDDIRDLDKVEQSRLQLDMAAHDLAAIVEQAINQHQGMAAKYGVQLTLSHSEPTPCRADAHRLEQVLSNILSNAIKHSPQDVAVEVAVGPVDGWARATVTNGGPGIPPEFAPRVFEKFAQAESSDTRTHGGTGLGLAISKALIERMGGAIAFESEPGRTVFAVDVPTHPAT